MYKNDLSPIIGHSQALQFVEGGGVFQFRHLFSRAERWRPRLGVHRRADLPEHFHDLYHVVLYVEGEGEFDWNGARRRFVPGTLAATSPGEPHRFGGHDDCGVEVCYLAFTFDLVNADGAPLRLTFAELLARYNSAPPPEGGLSRHLSGGSLDGAMEAMEALIGMSLGYERGVGLAAAAAIAKLLAIIANAEGGAATNAADSRMSRASRIIEADTLGTRRVEEIAESVGMSPAHFIRSFKKAFGVTPIRHNLDVRLNRVKGLLIEGDIPLKSIAEALGFHDEFHLSKAFKMKFGEPPATFRRRLQGKAK